jgi:diadenylate cyclase
MVKVTITKKRNVEDRTLHQDCDSSLVKTQLKEHLSQVIADITKSLSALEYENECLLSQFEHIREKFISIESIAASYYLKCYLSPFTDKYNDISIGVQHLSERRHGALIVVERNDPLDSYITPGIPIEATITYSLLESIFFPGNPLHDGAIWVRVNKIISAANVLPLFVSSVRDKSLGTRHRAALGLTEKTDALVLVVSEETGRISFALNGKLYPLSI